MNLKNQRPVFVPQEFFAEFDGLSKAALMDIAWDFAKQLSEAPESDDAATAVELRKRAHLINHYRRQAR